MAPVVSHRNGASRKGRGAADGLGTVYGVTRERIRQVEMMGLKKLSRGPLRERLASFIGG
jgi:DNA-directed RNA polymerase sigma subunit (sigma70/sigma32)